MRTFTLVFLLFVSRAAAAQHFVPDAHGYVANPKFHQLIKTAGYELVGAFDTLSVKPLLIAAPVRKAGKWSYIGTNGKAVNTAGIQFPEDQDEVMYTVEPKLLYDEADAPLYKNYKVITKKEKQGLANLEGKVLIGPVYDQILLEEDYLTRGIIRVRIGTRWGAFRTDGSGFLPVSYDEISLYRFNGMGDWVLRLKKEGQYGLASFENPELVPANYEEPVGKTGLLFVVKRDGKYGALDVSGQKLVLKFAYDDIKHVRAVGDCPRSGNLYQLLQRDKDNNYTLFDLSNGTFSDVYNEIAYFADGYYCKVRKGSLYGYLDCTGEPAFPIQFQWVSDQVCGGKALVRQDGKYGIVNMQGNFTLAPTLDLKECDFLRCYKEGIGCYPVENRLLFITRDEKGRRRYGVIDHQGKVLIPAIYNFIEMETVQDQLIQVRLGENYGLLNLSGEIRIPVDCSFITGHDLPGVYKAMPAHTEVLMDCYGNMALP